MGEVRKQSRYRAGGEEMTNEWITDKAKELSRVLGITAPASIHLIESTIDVAYIKGGFDKELKHADKLLREARDATMPGR